jgi:hypothetical protein
VDVLALEEFAGEHAGGSVWSAAGC